MALKLTEGDLVIRRRADIVRRFARITDVHGFNSRVDVDWLDAEGIVTGRCDRLPINNFISLAPPIAKVLEKHFKKQAKKRAKKKCYVDPNFVRVCIDGKPVLTLRRDKATIFNALQQGRSIGALKLHRVDLTGGGLTVVKEEISLCDIDPCQLKQYIQQHGRYE